METFSVGGGEAGDTRPLSQQGNPQTVTIHTAIQEEHDQQVKKHHIESNPSVCLFDIMSRNIDASPSHLSIFLEEAVLETYRAPALVHVVH
jgi:hypothetical protein